MRLGIAALTLAFALAITGLVWGEEPSSGSWFSRMFSRNSAKPEPPAPKTDLPVPSAQTIARRIKQAQTTLYRRQEVCLELMDVADKLGDENLRKKAEQLERRAWEAYEAATSAYPLPNHAVTQPDRSTAAARDRSAKESR